MKNRKTTLWGIIAAVMMFLGPQAETRAQGLPAPPITISTVAAAVAVALMGKKAADASDDN